MKTLFSILAACALSTAPALADLTIVQTVEGLGQRTENTALFKAGKTRVNTSPGTSIIMDLKTGEMLNLMHPQKTFLKVSSEMARAAVESMKQMQGGQSDAKPQLTATGNKATISSYAAEEYTCTVAGVKISLWLTKALPDYQTALQDMAAAFKDGPLAAMMQGYGVDMAHLPGFPVRTVLELQPGQTMTRTVTSVSTQPIADAEFEVPAGYTEVSVPTTLTPPPAAEGGTTK